MKSKVVSILATNNYVSICRDDETRIKVYTDISNSSKYRIEKLTLRYNTSIWFTSQGLHLFIYNEKRG